jgi:hypothetical protein
MFSLLDSTLTTQYLDPGDAGWGDVLFVSIWGVASLLLAAYFCYRAFFGSR